MSRKYMTHKKTGANRSKPTISLAELGEYQDMHATARHQHRIVKARSTCPSSTAADVKRGGRLLQRGGRVNVQVHIVLRHFVLYTDCVAIK